MRYFPLTPAQVARRRPAWERLFRRQPGPVAVALAGKPPDDTAIRQAHPEIEQLRLTGPAGAHPEWDAVILEQVKALHRLARSRCQGDDFPALSIPRPIHGASQGLAEAFGCRLVDQASGNIYAEPCLHLPTDVTHLKIRPVNECRYGQALEFARYARAVTGGELALRNPVMTGPLDTANYLLGTMTLMHWIYDEPQALRQLLQRVTDFLIEVLRRLQAAADGQLCPDLCGCLDRGFGLCSEVRSLVALETYAEFEAPYLRQIGEACDPFAVHSCGTWEHVLPATVADPHIYCVDFGCREMDLRQACALTNGRLSLKVHPSTNLGERYTFPDFAAFLRYVMTAVDRPVPLCVGINYDHLGVYRALQGELQGQIQDLFARRLT